jgi:hypothetical protein
MSENYTITQDLKEAQAMVERFGDYVQGSELYVQVGSGGFFGGWGMPSLTTGALLMRLRRLEALRMQMDTKQREQFQAIVSQHRAVKQEWRQHYERKLLREAHSRLDAMQHFFQEMRENPRDSSGNYKIEVSRRTIIQELLREIAEMNLQSEELDQKAKRTDAAFASTLPTDAGFQWAALLESVYPRQEFWWLYRKPRKV